MHGYVHRQRDVCGDRSPRAAYLLSTCRLLSVRLAMYLATARSEPPMPLRIHARHRLLKGAAKFRVCVNAATSVPRRM
eukprot:1776229-Pleurochrysis_carterae.AAC.1